MQRCRKLTNFLLKNLDDEMPTGAEMVIQWALKAGISENAIVAAKETLGIVVTFSKKNNDECRNSRISVRQPKSKVRTRSKSLMGHPYPKDAFDRSLDGDAESKTKKVTPKINGGHLSSMIPMFPESYVHKGSMIREYENPYKSSTSIIGVLCGIAN